jgi:hypothetical protein
MYEEGKGSSWEIEEVVGKYYSVGGKRDKYE